MSTRKKSELPTTFARVVSILLACGALGGCGRPDAGGSHAGAAGNGAAGNGADVTGADASWSLPSRIRARATYPLSLPELRKVQMDFPRGWFKVRHIPVVAERVQTDTYLACVILSETIGHMLDSFVRDYLGGYIVHFAQPAGTRVVADSDWIVP